MAKSEDTGSPGWRASLFLQTTEDVVARAVAAAAAAAAAPRSPRPSVVFSSKDDHSDTQFQKLQRHVTRVLKGFSSPPPEVKAGTYNPEVLTSQKRQWANFQLQYLDHRCLKEPSRLFESMVVVGLHPNCDLQALQRQYITRSSEGSGRLQGSLGGQYQSRVEPILEPQVLFVYPPDKQLPLKYKDLLSFCFPGGLEVHAVEKTPSMSELNEILLGQEHLKQSDLSFVFRLQVADDSTLYGCCVLVDEIVQKPSGLLSMISDKRSSCSSLSRYVLTTRRCYCILSRLPFFELHFGVLNSIFTEERLERLTRDIGAFDLESSEGYGEDENLGGNLDSVSPNYRAAEDVLDGAVETNQSSLRDSTPGDDNKSHMDHHIHEGHVDLLQKGVNANVVVPVESESEIVSDKGEYKSHLEHHIPEGHTDLLHKGVNANVVVPVESETEIVSDKGESGGGNLEDCDIYGDDLSNKQAEDRRLPNAVLPLLRYYQYESSESSSSFQGSPSEDRNFRSDVDDTETEEASISGQEDTNDYMDILEWAKANNHGSLQIICEYYLLHCPSRGSTLRFHPLEHLHPLEYHRTDETVLHIAGSTIDLRTCSTSLEFAEAHSALSAEEEATALSTWAVACICGSLRLENVLTLFAGALLEKQIVFVCSNLGILSASVLSIVPLIRPYQWQSLLMPILPDDMLDFLDAPVPYIVGVKNKTSEVQSKLTNVILVDVNKNQVKSPTIPQLPKHRELFSSLSPYHAKLVGESYLARRRAVHECTDVQIEAAKGFVSVLRSYLDSLCSNLRSHTITNVQSNNDKVSLLLKESFIDSFPSRDRSFMKFLLSSCFDITIAQIVVDESALISSFDVTTTQTVVDESTLTSFSLMVLSSSS